MGPSLNYANGWRNLLCAQTTTLWLKERMVITPQLVFPFTKVDTSPVRKHTGLIVAVVAAA
jgi:hypothetical protein